MAVACFSFTGKKDDKGKKGEQHFTSSVLWVTGNECTFSFSSSVHQLPEAGWFIHSCTGHCGLWFPVSLWWFWAVEQQLVTLVLSVENEPSRSRFHSPAMLAVWPVYVTVFCEWRVKPVEQCRSQQAVIGQIVSHSRSWFVLSWCV